MAGYQTWRKMDRFVRAGEKGIPIFAPMVFKRQEATDPDGLATVEKAHLWFKVVYVFDIGQTDGKALPNLPTGCAGECWRPGAAPVRIRCREGHKGRDWGDW